MVGIVKKMRYFDKSIAYMIDKDVRSKIEANSCYVKIDPDALSEENNTPIQG